jgi:hypothetical protein
MLSATVHDTTLDRLEVLRSGASPSSYVRRGPLLKAGEEPEVPHLRTNSDGRPSPALESAIADAIANRRADHGEDRQQVADTEHGIELAASCH